MASGLTKIGLIAGLLRGKLGFYPAAIVVFLLFVIYQLYRYSLTHALWLVILTLVDVVVIWLTWREYKDMRSVHVLRVPESDPKKDSLTSDSPTAL